MIIFIFHFARFPTTRLRNGRSLPVPRHLGHGRYSILISLRKLFLTTGKHVAVLMVNMRLLVDVNFRLPCLARRLSCDIYLHIHE